MNIGINATSTADFSKEQLKQMNMDIIHFHVEKDGITYRDDAFTVGELFEFTQATKKMCHTAAPNVEEYEQYFEAELKKYDQIIHFTMSSKLSSCYDNAVAATHGNKNIVIIDTKGTGGASALLATYAIRLRDAGYSFEKIVEKALQRVEFASTSFIIKDMTYLYKGGRCTGLKYFASKLLRLRPVIETDKEGNFVVGKIYRGDSSKCIRKYVEDRLASYENIDYDTAYMNISTCDDEMVKEIEELLKAKGFKHVYFNPSCATNSYHAGPSVMGVQFMYDGEHIVKPAE